MSSFFNCKTRTFPTCNEISCRDGKVMGLGLNPAAFPEESASGGRFFAGFRRRYFLSPGGNVIDCRSWFAGNES
jgi:hypothetical protein